MKVTSKAIRRAAPWLALWYAAILVVPVRAAIPTRIVSTSPSITETLFALGLGERSSIVLAQGRVALDCPVEEAVRSPGWLSLFSPRLTLSTTASGRSWVSYS